MIPEPNIVSNVQPQPLDFWNWLQNQAPVIVFLAMAVFVVGYLLIKQNAKLDASKEERLKEHKERIDKVEEHNQVLEKRVDDCEEDRRQLREELSRKADR